MTSLVPSRSRRGASIALGAMVIAAGSLLITAPIVSAEPSTEAVDAIDSRYEAFGGVTSLLGAPVGEAVDVPGGAERDYEGGAIYYSKDTGAHVMYGAILDHYKDLGGPVGSALGFPTNDEGDTGDGTGRFNDFSAPEGASMYWNPQWGASVIRGRVLEAWRQSGGITGPFGYPSADTSIADGVQTGKFIGPEGTEIQWSQEAGLVTIPAAIAATLPGFGPPTPAAEGTTSVTTPSPSGVAGPDAPKKISKWWWIPAGVAVLALLGGLLRLLTRKPVARPAPENIRKVVAPPPPPPAPPAPPAPPVTAAPPPPPIRPVVSTASAPVPPAPRPPVPPAAPPVRPAPPKPPAKVVPLVKTPPPAPARVPPPRPPVAPRPRPVIAETPKAEPAKVEPPTVVPAELAEPPKATIHTAPVEHDVSPVIKYESHAPAETTMQVTYENNAIGDNQKSVADKSDTVPDSQQL